MRRKPFECTSCYRRFKIPQALFGHLRHCKYHRLKRQAKAEAENQAPGQRQSQLNMPGPSAGHTDEAAFSQRRGRDSQEHLLLLLDVSEVFPELKRKCLDYAAIARMLANVSPWMTSIEKWLSLYWMIDECERDHEQMVMQLRLDRRRLFGIYQRMLVVKRNWLGYLSVDWGNQDGPVSDETIASKAAALDEEERFLNPIMANIKKMLVAAH